MSHHTVLGLVMFVPAWAGMAAWYAHNVRATVRATRDK